MSRPHLLLIQDAGVHPKLGRLVAMYLHQLASKSFMQKLDQVPPPLQCVLGWGPVLRKGPGRVRLLTAGPAVRPSQARSAQLSLAAPPGFAQRLADMLRLRAPNAYPGLRG